jgi:hypothetical protein
MAHIVMTNTPKSILVMDLFDPLLTTIVLAYCLLGLFKCNGTFDELRVIVLIKVKDDEVPVLIFSHFSALPSPVMMVVGTRTS